MAARTEFLKLSLDIHILVLEFLPALDILSFGQTCRQLKKITEQRVVWANALRFTLEALHIPLAEYGDIIADAPTFQLMDLASNPDRLVRQLRRERPLRAISATSAVFFPRDGPQTISSAYFTTDGRYLVTLGQVHAPEVYSRLSIWDLSMDHSYSHPTLVQGAILEGLKDNIAAVCSARGEDDLGVWVVVQAERPGFDVYEAYRLGHTPTLTSQLETPARCLSVPNYHLLISSFSILAFNAPNSQSPELGTTVLLWNIEDNSLAGVHIDHFPIQVYIFKTDLLMMTEKHEYTVYDLPDFLPLQGNRPDTSHTQKLSPKYIFSNTIGRYGRNPSPGGEFIFLKNSAPFSQPRFAAYHCSADYNKIRFVNFLPGAIGDTTIECLPVLLSQTWIIWPEGETETDMDWQYLVPYKNGIIGAALCSDLSDSRLFVCSDQKDGTEAHSLALDFSSTGDGQIDENNREISALHFSPLHGRLYAFWNNDEGDGILTTFDFFRHPRPRYWTVCN